MTALNCSRLLVEETKISPAGLVRLRGHSTEQLARDSAQVPDHGESSLHFRAHQSGHAKPKRRLA